MDRLSTICIVLLPLFLRCDQFSFLAEKTLFQKYIENLADGGSQPFPTNCTRKLVGVDHFITNDCEIFVGHIWIGTNQTLPDSLRKLRVLFGCITVIDSDLREFSLSSLHLLVYNERICSPYALRFANNKRLERITFHRNFKWPKEHLILVTGQHRLTSERITPNGESFPLQSRVGDCRIDEKGEERCTMLYGTWDYNKISNQLHTLRTIEGRLVIDNTNLTDFSELENLTIIGLRPHALAVKRNPNLTDVSSLFKMNIKGPTPRVEWSLDGKEWCHSEADLQLLSRLTGETAVSLAFHVAFATSISGRVLDQGFLDELKERCKCFCVIQGDLVIKGLDASTIDLSPLRRIHAINGRLRIFDNTRLHSLSFLENLARIINPTDSPEPVIEIHGNKDLADVYLKNLHELRGSAGEIYTTWELDQRQQYKYKSFSTSAHFYVGDIPNYFIEREAKSKYPVSEVEFRNGSACFFSSRTKWRTLVSSSETCRHVYGDVEVDGVFFEYFRGKLTELKTITGCMTIEGLSLNESSSLTFPNLTAITYDAALCETYYALRILGNINLTQIVFHENFTLQGEKFIRGNRNDLVVQTGNQIWDEANYSSEDCYVRDSISRDTAPLYEGCTKFIGSVTIGKGFAPMNMPKITEIHGRFKITKTTLSSLDLMKDIKIFAHYPTALTIEDNYSLKDVSDLLYMAKNITRPKAFEERFKNRTQILLLNNGRICHNDETREALQALVPPEHPIEFSDHCRKRCVGGVVDDATLKHEDNIGCQVILGSLTIQNFNFNSSADLKYFNTIEDIEGSLTIINSTGFKDLTFFKSLKGITDFSTTRPLVRIAHNPDLTSITPLHNQVELLYDVEDVDTVAVIKTYSAIDAMERKELEKQGRVIFHVHVKERKRPPTGNGRKGQDKTWTDGKGKRESEADDSDNLKEGIAVVVGGSLCFIVFGYGYAFIVYQRDRRRLERQQQLRNQNANDDIDAVRSKAGIRSSTDSRSSEKGSSRHRKRK